MTVCLIGLIVFDGRWECDVIGSATLLNRTLTEQDKGVASAHWHPDTRRTGDAENQVSP